ncbi:MAG: aminotransferase class I/II-fold pyridoxal phosphate-dependent enzyme [bacterium]|nr:aminotransferase class I/II-fold pyridoxal phosphate-dependent enzyme [bacterium]
MFADLEQKIAEKTAAGRDVINLGIGDPDLMPPDSFTKSLQEHAADSDAHFYSSSRGDRGVRAAIATYFKGGSESNSIQTRRFAWCWGARKVCRRWAGRW